MPNTCINRTAYAKCVWLVMVISWQNIRFVTIVELNDLLQAQRARGKLIREVKENFKVDAFVGNATDWERVCMGNLVGIPVIVIPTGFKKISDPPTEDTRRRTAITTGIYAPPEHDHIVSSLNHMFVIVFLVRTLYFFCRD